MEICNIINKTEICDICNRMIRGNYCSCADTMAIQFSVGENNKVKVFYTYSPVKPGDSYQFRLLGGLRWYRVQGREINRQDIDKFLATGKTPGFKLL